MVPPSRGTHAVPRPCYEPGHLPSDPGCALPHPTPHRGGELGPPSSRECGAGVRLSPGPESGALGDTGDQPGEVAHRFRWSG